MDQVWEDLHSTRDWGKYPAEDLIRRVMRHVRSRDDRENSAVLELGCGAGANLSFFIAEGFQVTGIDGAPSAIANAKTRLEPLLSEGQRLDLDVCYFENIDFPEASFDLIVDYLAIYANRLELIQAVYGKAKRLLTPEGRFYTRVWGTACDGAGTGHMIEPGTSQNPTHGPCKDMGVSHFFSVEELRDIFADWSDVAITRFTTEADDKSSFWEEFVVWAKP